MARRRLSKPPIVLEPLAYTWRGSGSFDRVLERLQNTLPRHRFGVLATLRIDTILREKIGARTEPLAILEVCSPVHAHQALELSRDAALFLPCKVVVSRDGSRVRVALLRPSVSVATFLPLPQLEGLARQVEEELRTALEAALTVSTFHSAGADDTVVQATD